MKTYSIQINLTSYLVRKNVGVSKNCSICSLGAFKVECPSLLGTAYVEPPSKRREDGISPRHPLHQWSSLINLTVIAFPQGSFV